ncbi:MAG: PEP-CTERM sorting domain-containing protein, partial [bacterium]|nr:PEP-CTERM sorting domain-containing protein [bacterium]
AAAVSDDGGIIVGRAQVGTTEAGYRAFLWDSAHGMRDLRAILVDEVGLNLDGWTLTWATDVSADGLTFAGTGINPSGFQEAWIARIPEPATHGPLAVALLICASRRRLQLA